MNFDEVADTIDEEDNEISGDGGEKLKSTNVMEDHTQWHLDLRMESSSFHYVTYHDQSCQ